MSGRLLGAVIAVAVLGHAAAAHAASAPGGPGALSHFDLARKDCVGTAQNTRSKVWFTVADGVLSDVYYPTNDNTNNETLQYVVTDGKSFTDLQTRDMTYTVSQPDDRALTCRVTATDKDGRYKLVTDYLTDPKRPTVLMHTRFVPLRGRLSDYALYVRFDPTLNGNGGGGARQRRRRQRHRGHQPQAHGARRLGPGDRDAGGQPRLRAARVQRAGHRRGPPPGLQRLRRHRQRRAHAARRRAPADHDLHGRRPRATSSRPAASTSATTATSRSRSASAPTRTAR